MKSILRPFVALLSLSAIAEEHRVYRVDRYGNVKYSEPSYSVVKDDRIVEVDAYGSRQPQKPQHVVRNSMVYEADSYGRVRYVYAVGKDGRVVQTDAYGNKRYDRPQYKLVDGKVYETDAYGLVQQHKFIIKNEQRRSK